MKEAVYDLLGVPQGEALRASRAYSAFDQAAIKKGVWDYDDPNFICRQVVELIEGTPLDELTEEEQEWFQEIAWFWHHHAISWMIWHDQKERAREEAALALSLQDADHPNRITRLLYLLVQDRLEEAKDHVSYGPSGWDEVERDTGKWLLEEYRSERWPLPKSIAEMQG